MPSLESAYLQKRYTWLALIVILLSGGVLGLVFFSGPSRATVTISTTPTTINADVDLTLNGGADTTSLAGTMTSAPASATVTATPSGAGVEVDAHATGTMTIVNHSSSTQVLAATTRLAAADGSIVRTAKRVDVAAGQEVDVPVTADALGTSGNLPPGTFTIVALWPGLQTKIYGDLRAAMTGGTIHQGSALDVDSLTKASDEAKKKIEDAHLSTATSTVTLTPLNVVSNPPVATPSASYEVTVTMNVLTVTYAAEDLQKVMGAELTKHLADGFQVSTIAPATWSLTDSTDTAHPVFHLKLSGTATLAPSAPAIASSKVAGQSVADAITTLRGVTGVSSVSISLNHSWQHALPKDASRITVVLTPAS